MGDNLLPPGLDATGIWDSMRLTLEKSKQIGTESGYERIVVDMGHMGKGSLELFAACDVVYMPVLDDPVSPGV